MRQEAAANASRGMLQKARMQHLAEGRAKKRRHMDTPQSSVMVENVMIAAPATDTAPDTGSRPTTNDVGRKQL